MSPTSKSLQFRPTPHTTTQFHLPRLFLYNSRCHSLLLPSILTQDLLRHCPLGTELSPLVSLFLRGLQSLAPFPWLYLRRRLSILHTQGVPAYQRLRHSIMGNSNRPIKRCHLLQYPDSPAANELSDGQSISHIKCRSGYVPRTSTPSTITIHPAIV